MFNWRPIRGGILATLLLCGTTPTPLQAAGAWTPLGLFEGRNADLEWKAPDGSAIRPQPDLYNGQAGLRMKVPMPRVADRFYRDAALSLDLAAFTEFSLAIRISNPEAVARCSLYFKSGGGWYGGWFTAGSTQWQTVTLARGAFSAEGTPAGWNRIEGVRLAFWKAGDADTRVEIADLRGRSSPIAILNNSSAGNSMPAEKPVIDRAVERLRLWFEGCGLHAGVMDDDDLTGNGPPPGTRLMILPFNPDLTPTTVKVLQAFVAKGGKLIVAYALPPELAPLLGLGGKRWMKADPPDLFSAIHFNTNAPGGLPPAVGQGSWNANIPEPLSARIVGTWAGATGTGPGLAAVTIGDGGVFIGHVLTNVDRDRKMQMLLALSVALAPDLAPLLAGQLRDQASRLFGLADWTQTRDFIAQTAARHGRRRAAETALPAIDKALANAQQGGNAEFGDRYAESESLRRLVRQAYFEAVGPVPEARELRGAWCHHAAGVPGQPWAATVRQFKHAGLNTLFANHQWAGVAYYPSKVLPVSPLVAAQGDLLRQCLDACRGEGVALHLWSVLWVLENAPEAFVGEMDKAGRLMKDRYGKTVKWLCPANPLNLELAVNAAVEAVRQYEVDGFHLDYIRYPDGDSCYCGVCASRFRKDTGRAAVQWPADVVTGPDREAFQAWRRQQITAAVGRIRREVKAARPSVLVSAAVWAGWPGVRDSIGQDWVSWCRDGLLDFVCPMNYVTTAAEAVSLFNSQRSAVGPSVPLYPGIAPTSCNLPPEETVRQVDSLRQAGAKGFVLFELDQDLQDMHLPALRAGATSD